MSKSKSKIAKSHSTQISAARTVSNAALKHYKLVNKVSLGVISPCSVINGKRRVKFSNEQHCILASIRDTNAVQEVRIYSNEGAKLILLMKEELEKQDFIVNVIDTNNQLTPDQQ